MHYIKETKAFCRHQLTISFIIFSFFSNGVYEPEEHEYTFGKSLVLAVGSLTQRGWSVVPNKIAARTVFFM